MKAQGDVKNRRSVRHFKPEPVPRETIEQVMEIVRYAPSGANMQPVQYIIITDPAEVKRLAGVTIEWMRDEIAADSPLSKGLPLQYLVDAWERGSDSICRGAPHLVIAHTPAGNSSAPVDAIIGLTHFDVAVPAFGVGACWAGFLSIGAMASEKVKQALAIPTTPLYKFSKLERLFLPTMIEKKLHKEIKENKKNFG